MWVWDSPATIKLEGLFRLDWRASGKDHGTGPGSAVTRKCKIIEGVLERDNMAKYLVSAPQDGYSFADYLNAYPMGAPGSRYFVQIGKGRWRL